MKIGVEFESHGSFADAVSDVVAYERVGLDLVSVPEAYSFDAVSRLGYLAAVTNRLEITSGIMQTYSRTPTLTAMTAAGLDYVSGGRFVLGLGASGPQVVEGFHGVRYNAPLGRMRETVEICRMVWRREKVEYQGKYFTVPLPADQGTGLGKSLKLIEHPYRATIPIVLAAIGPKSVELAAEIADGWEPLYYFPEHAADVWGESLAAGAAKRSSTLGPLDVIAVTACAIGEDVLPIRDQARAQMALYIGGMGARGANFYNTLVQRYGFAAEARLVQDLYLDGHKAEAAAAIPQALIDGTSLVGSVGFVRDRLAAFAANGVNTLKVFLPQRSQAERVRTVELLRTLADEL